MLALRGHLLLTSYFGGPKRFFPDLAAAGPGASSLPTKRHPIVANLLHEIGEARGILSGDMENEFAAGIFSPLISHQAGSCRKLNPESKGGLCLRELSPDNPAQASFRKIDAEWVRYPDHPTETTCRPIFPPPREGPRPSFLKV
jgi:hypothetical protein